MKLSFLLYAILFFCMLITGILFILFGETTVRRLRKNPETKEALGFDFIGGRDIMNVAIALSMPKRLMNKAKKSKINFMFADIEVLNKYTSRYDIILAKIFYYLFIFDGLLIFTLIGMKLLGITIVL